MPISKKTPKKLLTDKQFLLASLVILLFSIIVLGLSLKTQHDTRRLYGFSANQSTPFKIGQQVNMGAVGISVKKVSYPSGQKPFIPPSGKQYAVITLDIKNRTDKPINIAPASDTYIKDSSGNVSYLTPYALGNPFRAGELPPGEEIVGDLSYLVPKTAQNKFYIDAIWSGGVLSFRL
jgi:hypothetical protein